MTRTRLLGLLLLLGAALDSQALTLGRARGAAILGQGLDISVQVTPDADESSSELCLEADVFYADARQDPARVQISLEPAAAGQPVNARIVSRAAIDEPMVTVYLRAGCAQKTSRRYVLLSDIASEPVAAAPQRAAVPALAVPLVTPPAAPAAGAALAPAASAGDTGAATLATPAAVAEPGPGAGAAGASKPAARARPRPAPAAAAAKAAPTRTPVAKPAPSPAPAVAEKQLAGRAAGQSRLRLDPVEVLAERVATLESAAASAPVASGTRSPQDLQRLQTLEDSVKTLVALASKNEAALVDMRKRLQQADSDRYLNPWFIGLVLALLASLVTIAVLLSRRTRQAGADKWWGEGAAAQPAPARQSETRPAPAGVAPSAGPDSVPAVVSAPGELPLTLEQMQKAARSRSAPVTQVDVSLVEMSESTFDRLMQSGATHSAVRKVRSTAPAPIEAQPASTRRRLINSDELFDIRQQAEFFVSLGQTDQAVRILENRISESGESSPAAYLDLLKIFHALGLKADFRQVREDFNLLFNAKVPDFASFADEGQALEDYPQVLAGIERVWGTGDVLSTIESLLYREQWNAALELFDLAAFRDLLVLHAVAQTAVSLSGELVLPAAASATRGGMPPASQYGLTLPGNVPLVVPAMATVPGSVADAPLPDLDGSAGVDIDLSDVLAPAFAEGVDGASVPTLPADSALDNLIQFDLPAGDSTGKTTGPGAG